MTSPRASRTIQVMTRVTIALAMLNTSLDAFVHADPTLARSLAVRDEEVDELITRFLSCVRDDEGRRDEGYV